MDDAAHGGFLNVVQFLQQHCTEGCSSRALLAMAILKW